MTFKPVIQANAIEAIKLLVNACKDFEYEFDESNKKRAQNYFEINALETNLSSDIKNDIKELWKDPAVQKAWKRNGEFQLHDSSG